MKINNYNSNDNLNPQIVVNVSGTLMYFNEDARKVFKLKIKSDISNIIDLNTIKKFSMYSDKTEIVETLHPVYKYAIMSISGNGINKIINIIFKSLLGKNGEILKTEKNILMIANKITLNKNISYVSMEELSQKIKEISVSNGYFLNTYIKITERVKVNQSHIQALILCAIAMMNETSSKRPVDLYIKRNFRNFIEIKIMVRVDSNIEKFIIQDIEEVFPWCAIRVAAIDEICKKSNIDYNVSLAEKSLKVVYTFAEESLLSTKVNGINIDRITLEELYKLLCPREDINLNYEV